MLSWFWWGASLSNRLDSFLTCTVGEDSLSSRSWGSAVFIQKERLALCFGERCSCPTVAGCFPESTWELGLRFLDPRNVPGSSELKPSGETAASRFYTFRDAPTTVCSPSASDFPYLSFSYVSCLCFLCYYIYSIADFSLAKSFCVSVNL